MEIAQLKDFLADQRKKSEILDYLASQGISINERSLREKFSDYNREYENGEMELFLAHSSDGYILTDDESTIKKSLLDDKKRGLKMLHRYYRCLKVLNEKKQLALEPQDADLYELVRKMYGD